MCIKSLPDYKIFGLDQIASMFSRLSKYGLTNYQTTNFRLFQTERVCRRRFQISRKWQKVIKRVENNVGKGEIAG